MRTWLVFLLLIGVLALPFSVHAQNAINFSALRVQLWPEYDQPSMLVIYDFKLTEGAALPVTVNIRIPKAANLWSVAYDDNGNLINATYDGPTPQGDWQTVAVNIEKAASYRVEYYEPLSISGSSRQFSYLWPGDYAVQDFSLSLRSPLDTTAMNTEPVLESKQGTDGVTYLEKSSAPLPAGQQFTLNINYTKTSDNLAVPPQNVQPSQPLGANTPGRVMFSNYLPYLLGGLGLVLIVGGLIYYWQTGRNAGGAIRKRHPSRAEAGGEGDIHCHQCGTRAHSGDRFCRVCGTKLRLEE